jgi:DNA-binding transcriptional LysR family regulator
LLEVRTPARTWERWFAKAGCDPNSLQLRHFDMLHLTYEAAAAGLGVCLAAPLTAEPFLRAGKLVPCGQRVSLGEAYYLCRVARRAPLTVQERRFASWVRGEAANSLEEFIALGDVAGAPTTPWRLAEPP